MGDIILILMGIMIAAVFAYFAWDAIHSNSKK
ncbi:hypothetical protein SAMN05421880_12130 [Nitrosomonas nitrosa]|jgi:hypothetical protein|uniref:Uncharacterized protein n=1 Tax=Nitrosomonas nitrosa TaxID=52442 RepID=A0A1I4RWU9_9PROT|nr:hypothetical protein SAMN05421880_12130 [Nitrosomonas nitrosa]